MMKNLKTNSNQKGSAAVVAVVLISVAVFAGLFALKMSRGNKVPLDNNVNNPVVSTPPNPAASSTPPPTSQATENNDNSDAQLDQDLQNTGGNLDNLDNQSSDVDQGLSQKAVDPTQ